MTAPAPSPTRSRQTLVRLPVVSRERARTHRACTQLRMLLQGSGVQRAMRSARSAEGRLRPAPCSLGAGRVGLNPQLGLGTRLSCSLLRCTPLRYRRFDARELD